MLKGNKKFREIYRSQPATHDMDDHTVDTAGEEGEAEEEDGEAAA